MDGEAKRGALMASDVELSALADALPWGIIVTSLGGEILGWNRQAESLYGWSADEVIGGSITDVALGLVDPVRAEEIVEAVRSGRTWEGELRMIRRDGEPLRVWVSDRPVFDHEGNVIAIAGISDDLAPQHQALERQAADLAEHLRLALHAGGLGTFRWDMATSSTTWDEQLEALFGLEPGGFDGTFDGWVALLHPDDRDRVLRTVEQAVEAKSAYKVDHRVVWPDGSVHWLQGLGQALVDGSGEVTGTIGCVRDVTQQTLSKMDLERQTAEAVAAAGRERVHRERLEFLGRVNEAVAVASDRRGVMRNVARAAVPRLGDWCSVFVLPEPDATVPEIETAHADRAMLERVAGGLERRPYDPDAPHGMPRVIRTGEAEFYPAIDDGLIDELVPPADRELVRSLSLRSAIAVPIVKRGRILGGLQLVMTNDSRPYTDDDLALAHAVAARVGSTLENLRLSEERRRVAAALQASLLPDELPDIPGVELAVRYWAHGDGVDVGGDFYDVFQVTSGVWALVIGDVCGTGPAAAAITGLARNAIEGAALHGDDHAEVMTHLNERLRRRRVSSFCTALYGTLEPTSSGCTFTVASAGHPLPIVANPRGSARSVGSHGTLLGLLERIKTTTTTTRLVAGDAVVLYTDGVTDVAPPHGLRTEELIGLVQRATAETQTAEELADRLEEHIAAILPIERRTDDLALLVVRLTDPDRAMPSGSGSPGSGTHDIGVGTSGQEPCLAGFGAHEMGRDRAVRTSAAPQEVSGATEGHKRPRQALRSERMSHTVKRELPLAPASVAVARAEVVDALRAAGFTGDVAAAVLLTSELVTNAVRHAQAPLTIEVVADTATATVKVIDGDRWRLPMIRRDESSSASDGRGLKIVDRLARDWGVEIGDSGKTVWFTAN